jgi:charged multivesicular body protein 3
MLKISSLMSVPEMNKVMREMAKEMQKAGIIEEMMEDSFDMMADEDEEDEAEEEVNKVVLMALI